MSLGEVLVAKELVSQAQLAEAQAVCEGSGNRLDRVLLKLGFVGEADLLRVLSDQFSIPVVDLLSEPIDTELLKSMPARLIHRRRILPFAARNGNLIVATSDPFDVFALDELRAMTGKHVEPVLAAEREIAALIKRYFGVGGAAIDQMMLESGEEVHDVEVSDAALLEQAQEATVVKLVNEILREAINDRASDIHFEPFEEDLRIRYRVDGVLHTTNVPEQIKRFQAAIISRIKIMASMNIAEKRRPQDGGFKIRHEGREIDIRVSVLPSVFGEGVVLRILDRSAAVISLTELGMDEDTYTAFDELINLPHGIILVTGPTGSGKTTTLYAALNAIVSDQIKVITVEDPVEYRLMGVNQIQVHPGIDLTFAAALRSILRHDPDVIMIGEIRDLETAEAAIQASLTGHLVFSTLHTNDACSAATRLTDMGVEPYLVSSSVVGVMAQRLVRTNCEFCREPMTIDRDKLPKDFALEAGAVLYHGRGCRECRHTGLRGRVGLFELVPFGGEIREAITDGASADKLLKIACRQGARMLREDGWNKVRAGLTVPDEVLRATVFQGK
ncbi:MAG: type II/IV secretion system protein [Phycisphaerae bacterium]|nr:type II/IV secretion system protein [Phycisphaerae bacterium]